MNPPKRNKTQKWVDNLSSKTTSTKRVLALACKCGAEVDIWSSEDFQERYHDGDGIYIKKKKSQTPIKRAVYAIIIIIINPSESTDQKKKKKETQEHTAESQEPAMRKQSIVGLNFELPTPIARHPLGGADPDEIIRCLGFTTDARLLRETARIEGFSLGKRGEREIRIARIKHSEQVDDEYP